VAGKARTLVVQFGAGKWVLLLLRPGPLIRVPVFRAGSAALWSHRRTGVPGTPSGDPRLTICPADGRKAVNPGWQSVQNKANLWEDMNSVNQRPSKELGGNGVDCASARTKPICPGGVPSLKFQVSRWRTKVSRPLTSHFKLLRKRLTASLRTGPKRAKRTQFRSVKLEV
jgi:hypothetical protein